jgi:hypothetical protein
MKMKSLLVLFVTVFMVSCVAPPPRARTARQAPAPCTATIQPLRYHQFKMTYNIKLNYTAKDSAGVHDIAPKLLNQYFNEDGAADGNTFTEADGVTPNFYVNMTVNNDGNNHYTAYAEFSGWGQGFIANLNSGPSPYVDPSNMTKALVDNVYAYIHGGWHDSRQSCIDNGTPYPTKTTGKKKK